MATPCRIFAGMEKQKTIREKCTLKDLLLKYEFDTLVPDLILTDKPAKDNLYAFKEAFDELRRMEPGDPHGEEIVVDIEVETDDDSNEIERYLHASHCEGDFWEASLAKEVVIKADVSETRALAQILWHMTFYGFSSEERTIWDDVPHNRYDRKAALLKYRQHCNYTRIKCKRHPTEDDLRCGLSLDGWKIYEKREAHRNRAKRMRDARQDRAIAKYERMGKVKRTINELSEMVPTLTQGALDYLFDTVEICQLPFFSRTSNEEGRGEYIVELLTKYFNRDLSGYRRAEIVFASSSSNPVSESEVALISKGLPHFVESRQYLGITESLGNDLELRIVLSK